MSRGSSDCKVYVGNLPSGIRHRDLEDVFFKYGVIVNVDLHLNKPSPFAFVEFEDPRDAEDAVFGRDGYRLDGSQIRVEYPKSRDRGSRRGNGYSGGRGYGEGRGGGGGRSDFRSSKPRGHQLLVTGLPPSGSWQDLKDHFRMIGDVIFADVYKDGTGSVEFSREDHMNRALRDLDDSKFRSHEGETSYIHVKEPHERSYSLCQQSCSPQHRSYSPHQWSYSPYLSPSQSPHDRRSCRSRSRSRSRSWSRSRSR